MEVLYLSQEDLRKLCDSWNGACWWQHLHAVEARAAVSDAPDEEKEEMEKVYSDDSENVSSGSSSSSDSGASGDG